MRSDRQRFLNVLATLGAFLRRVARIDSHDLTASTCSLATQDRHKRAPRGIQNALCQFRACQATQVQVLDNDCRIGIRIPFRGLEMKIAALALNLQMGLRHTARHLTTAATAFLARAQAALLAAQGRLTAPKEARVRDRVALTIGQKDFQADIYSDRPTLIVRRRLIALRRQFAHNQRIPMPISSFDQITGLRRTSQRTMHLDLDRAAQFSWNLEQAASGYEVDPQLAQLDGVPLVAALEAREAPILVTMGKKGFERFVQSVGKTLDGRGRNVCATTTLEQRGQVVLGQELAHLLIVRALTLQHLVVDVARFVETSIQAAALLSVWVQAILIGSHAFNYTRLKPRVQHPSWAKAAKAARFIPGVNALGFRA